MRPATKLTSDLIFAADESYLEKRDSKVIKVLAGQQLWHSGRAHACGAKLLRSRNRFLPGAMLFPTLRIPQLCVHNQDPIL